MKATLPTLALFVSTLVACSTPAKTSTNVQPVPGATSAISAATSPAPVSPESSAVTSVPSAIVPVLPSALAPSEFATAWPSLMARLASSNAAEKARLVSPSVGLYLLDNPGAFIIVRKLTSLSEGPENLESPKACVVKDAPRLPTFSCDTNAWSATGCLHVAGAVAPLARVAEQQIEPAEGRKPNKADKAHFEELKKVERLITDAIFFEGTTYFFGKIGNQWQLIAIDAVTPCSA